VTRSNAPRSAGIGREIDRLAAYRIDALPSNPSSGDEGFWSPGRDDAGQRRRFARRRIAASMPWPCSDALRRRAERAG